MRLSISNIAWDPSEDQAVAELLKGHGVDAIDVAPGKYFPDVRKAGYQDVKVLREWWANRGIEIVGMQALLFGTTGLNVFGDAAVQEFMLTYLSAVCRIGGQLGARKLVFGSPKNRDRSGLSSDEVRAIAGNFFARLGDIAKVEGVTICLEPNPTHYGANFMCTSGETAAVVEYVNHPNIKMQLDTGACALNKEDPTEILTKYWNKIGHIHASEPDLVPISDGGVDHWTIGPLLEKLLPNHVVTIEMLATKSEPHLRSIDRAIRAAGAAYDPVW